MSKKPTIYDVADEAGVAPSTVSRTFSNPGRVSTETAEQVRAAAERIGYRTALVGQDARTARSRVLGLVVSDIGNPFFHDIIQGATTAAEDNGFTLTLSDSRESEARERATLERVLPSVSGIALASTRMTAAAIRRYARQRPLVVLNRDFGGLHSVTTDNAAGMKLALGHLATLGHSDIGYLAGPDNSWTDGVRWRSALDAAQILGVRVHHLGHHVPTVQGGRDAGAAGVSGGVTAAVTYNDQLALGLMHGLQQMGLVIPADFSIVGFDDVDASELVTPQLTTVAAQTPEMGALAVKLLVDLIAGRTTRTRTALVLPTELIARQSTATVSQAR